MSHVNKTATCWLWSSGLFTSGYGQFKVSGVPTPAHRVSYELFRGAIPIGKSVLHKCDVKSCVNPAHLFIGTQLDNMQDKVRKNRQARGENNGRANLTNDAVKQILTRYVPACPVNGRVPLSIEFGVSPQVIKRIVTGKSWKFLSKNPQRIA